MLPPTWRRAHGFCESCSFSFLPSWLDLEGVLGPPLEAHPSAPGLESVLRGRLEVLLDHRQLASGLELDDVPREHAAVDDVANESGFGRVATFGLVADVQHADLLRAAG